MTHKWQVDGVMTRHSGKKTFSDFNQIPPPLLEEWLHYAHPPVPILWRNNQQYFFFLHPHRWCAQILDHRGQFLLWEGRQGSRWLGWLSLLGMFLSKDNIFVFHFAPLQNEQIKKVRWHLVQQWKYLYLVEARRCRWFCPHLLSSFHGQRSHPPIFASWKRNNI